MYLRSLALALVLAGVGVGTASLSLAQVDISTRREVGNRPASVCREVVLSRKPGWTLSGGFTPDGSQLLIVDSLYSTILRYGNSGESLGPIREPVKALVADQMPVTGRPRGESFILEVTDGLMVMDSDLHPVAIKRVQSNSQEWRKSKSQEWRITGLWEWQPVGKSDILAFADIGEGPNPYDPRHAKTAFVRFPLENPGQLTILQDFPVIGTPNKGYYRSTYSSYITSLGETGYYLSMNDGLRLYRQEKGKIPEDISSTLPPGLRAPKLPDWDHPQQFVDMMKRIERASMPVGLWGWYDSLYLLYRAPQGEGTRWTLYNIDPTRKHPQSSADLPISANHVTVVPGPKSWAIIEKGPVRAYGAQSISRVLFIPAQLLKAPLRSAGMLCGK